MTTPPISKQCPMCGDGRLVERFNTQNGSRFLGCTNYSPGTLGHCDHTEAVPTYVTLIQQGAPQLPGMEDY